MRIPLIRFEYFSEDEWIDATSVLLKLSDIEMVLNNYDTTLKEDTIDGVLSSVCLSEFPTLVNGVKIRIYQGNKVLHYGDITTFDVLEDADTFQVNFTSTPSYLRLKKNPNDNSVTSQYIIESYWLPLFQANPTLVPSSLITRQVYNYPGVDLELAVYTDGFKLMQFVFKHLTGYDLVFDTPTQSLANAFGYVVREVLWNYGCEFFGTDASQRNVEVIGTWFEWFELILRLGGVFWLDSNTGNYRVSFIPTNATSTPPAIEPQSNVISKKQSDMNLFHRYNNEWKYAWDYRWYVEWALGGREVNTTNRMGTILYPGGDEFLPNQAINHGWVARTSTDWKPLGVNIGVMSGRFYNEVQRITKYTIIDFDNWMYDTSWRWNINRATYIFNDGFFIMEVEFRSSL